MAHLYNYHVTLRGGSDQEMDDGWLEQGVYVLMMIMAAVQVM